MLFNSYVFVLFFLPIFVVGYFLLNHLHLYKVAMVFVAGMSLWFYGYFNPNYIYIIISSIILNYVLYQILHLEAVMGKKWILAIGIAANLGILFYYKYFDFFLMNVNTFLDKEYTLRKIILPLGISFFTFQQISFLIDTYRNEVSRYSFLSYICYVLFFPQLIAGPIVTHDELIPQLMDENRKSANWDNIAKGIYIFILGLSKKVLIADIFGNAANWGFSNIELLDSTNAIICMISYTIQIYFDFSGYCDMAMGIGKMLNIDLPLNFDSPYKALTITEFWNKWHITLTRFLTKYVYIPLGGSRRGQFRTYANTLIVFLFSGLWHGANWTFIFWGGCHGIFLVFSKHLKVTFQQLHPAFSWLITFGFINVTWVFFRAHSIGAALQMLNRIAVHEFGAINPNIADCFNLPEWMLVLGRTPILNIYPRIMLTVYFATAFILMLGTGSAYEKMKSFVPSIRRLLICSVLLIWCIFSFANVSTFLYFNF